MFWVSIRRALVVGLLGVVAYAGRLSAQTTDSAATETRARLTARLKRADSLHLRDEAFLLRARLQDGDFEVGDRITLTFSSPVLKQTDTVVTVRENKTIQLPEPLGDVNLNGVLRSELKDSVYARFNTYFKDVVVSVVPLIRLSISGAVRSAGFFYLRTDQPINDLINQTGGRDPSADLDNVVIKRGDRVLWGSEDTRAAFSDGLTVERLGLTSGDEMVVAFKPSNHWNLILPIFSAVLSVLLLYRQFKR
jgi:protein involved in polysaccharide export with SLBB domain